MADDALAELLVRSMKGRLVVPDAARGVQSWRVRLDEYDGKRVYLLTRIDAALRRMLVRRPPACATMHGINASVSIIGSAEHAMGRRHLDARGAEIGLVTLTVTRADVWRNSRDESLGLAAAALRHAFESPSTE